MKLALAGAGAFGRKHLDAIANIDGAEVVSVVGRTAEATKGVAAEYGSKDSEAVWSDDAAGCAGGGEE